ncbi:MAG: hypothetical protein K5665_08250 [Saccharofermentans sp.]|nr:hypothetical protein [Saccharofermentans sp.]
MKIKPSKDYKKPLYAIGLSAVIATSSLALTGCTDPAKEETTVAPETVEQIIETITAGIVYIHTEI